MNVLPDPICDEFLVKSLPYGEVKYKPKILCVGKVKSWNTEVWKATNSNYIKLGEKEAEKLISKHHFGEHLGFGGYVASAGTCRGDSGGPIYQKEVDPNSGKVLKHIITGNKRIFPIH